jgi:phosphate/sulfate permease/DNA-binding CsgD family transcriptional regulator
MLIFCLILISAVTGWWFATIEIPSAYSGISTSGAIGKRYLGTVIVLLAIAGAWMFGGRLSDDIHFRTGLTTPVSSMVVALSASLATLISFRFSKYTSICYGIFGALLAWTFFKTGSFLYVYTFKLLLSWMSAPVTALLISISLYKTYRYFILKSNVHLFSLMRNLRICLIIVAIAFSLAIGMNNGAMLMVLNKTVSPGFNYTAFAYPVDEQMILFAGSILCIALLFWKKTGSKIKEMAFRTYDTNIEATLVILLSVTVTIIFYSFSDLAGKVGLQVGPVSISGVTLGAFAGINYVKRKEWPESGIGWKLPASVILTPLLAFIFAYAALNMIKPDILSINDENILGASDSINITPAVIILSIFICLFLVVIYMRKQRKIRELIQLNLSENRHELFESQKVISTLEIKTIVAENEHLNHMLELQREELMSVALNISEHKKFLESIYREIKAIKTLDNTGLQQEAISRIEKMLFRKMNFSQEMDSFYDQVETLHKDFTLRLMDKHPRLTEQEKRLIILLRLGFSTKHIASLMNISPKSVEINRYRLRNKLKLGHKEKLTDFVKSI